MECFFLKIHGKVQGVFFRAKTKELADRLGITGWAKNEPDGTVIIEAQGEPDKLSKFLDWCKTGPKGAKVEKVVQERNTNTRVYNLFEIKY